MAGRPAASASTTAPAGDANAQVSGAAQASGEEKVSGEAKVRGVRLRPRDAATLVLVDRSAGEPRGLMGRRHATQVFLPNKFVFPGGRVDRGDRTMTSVDELPDDVVRLLLADMKGIASPARARALALAAVRETFEEAGLIIGCPTADVPPATTRGSRHASWQRFRQAGYAPSLSHLGLLARAITPPSRPRRYDTRFFLAEASAICADVRHADDELSELGWFTLTEMRALDLPNITRAIVEDLAVRLARPEVRLPVPYYSFRNGSFQRDLIE